MAVTVRIRAVCFLAAALGLAGGCREREQAATQGGAPSPPHSSTGGPLLLPPQSPERTSSGFATQVLVKGSGPVHPALRDRVQVKCVSRSGEGAIVFSGDPPLTLRIPTELQGWREALPLMVEGETRRIWIPAAEARDASRDKNSALSAGAVVDVTLITIEPAPRSPPVPADLGPPPEKAKRSPYGFSYEIRETRSEKAARPHPGDIVVYNGTCWDPRATVIASSYYDDDGGPSSTAMDDFSDEIEGAFELMRVGESARLWFALDDESDYEESRPARPQQQSFASAFAVPQRGRGPSEMPVRNNGSGNSSKFFVCDLELLYRYAASSTAGPHGRSPGKR